jgi:hypothetical protein
MNAPDFSDWLLDNQYKSTTISSERFFQAMLQLTKWHSIKCSSYGKILKLLNFSADNCGDVKDIPFIPVRMFKEFELSSVDTKDIFKVMMSSGTSGQTPSKIFLDRRNASFQTKVLARLMLHQVGPKRLPMLVLDSKNSVSSRETFSARGAGILGFSTFGRDVTYALNESMELDLASINSFINRHQDQEVFLFGFTFIVWKNFICELITRNINLPFKNGVLIHGGGWKKLYEEAVSNSVFSDTVKRITGVSRVVNYYGMVEQTGSLFMGCEFGNLHASIYSDVIIRSHLDFSEAEVGEDGLIQVLSVVPSSYPGHSLLTEDIGAMLGLDNCPCGLSGKYFEVKGRIEHSEVRGCSDTYGVS